jgi:hypothetical protein
MMTTIQMSHTWTEVPKESKQVIVFHPEAFTTWFLHSN